eukprot:Hpha_TRINITY_DN16540_c0_g2::TRINITY_DN16540_c0_g2_i1::g.134914::m.134914
MGCAVGCQRESKAEKEDRRKRIHQHRIAVLEAVKERRQEADAVQNDERVRYAVSVLSELPSAIVIWNEDGELMHVNTAAMELLDHDDDTILNGNHISKLLGLPRDLAEDFSRMIYMDVSGVRGFKGSGGSLGLRVYTTVMPIEGSTNLFVCTLRPHASPGVTPAASINIEGGIPMEDCTASAEGMRTACSSVASSRRIKLFGRSNKFASPGPEETPVATPTEEDLSDGSDFRSPRMRVHFSKLADDVCALLDSVRQPTMLVTEEGQIAHWTPACQEVFGPTAEEMYGHSCQLLIPDPFHLWHREYFAQMSRERNSVKRSKDSIGVSRHILTRQVRDVVARTIRSPSRDDEGWESKLIPVRMVISSVDVQGTHLWMCQLNVVGEFSKSSMAHVSFLQQASAHSQQHPATIPDEKPVIEVPQQNCNSRSPGFSRVCWQSESIIPFANKLKDLQLP